MANVIKKSFIILTILRESYDYDILLNYLRNNAKVNILCILPQGFLVGIIHDNDAERRGMIGSILRLDVKNIEIYNVLYEEFLPRSFV
jgi:hypothetical protein